DGDCGACAACSHDKCEAGTALQPGCDPCVTQICELDPSCCSNNWDSACAQAVHIVCNDGCGGAGGSGGAIYTGSLGFLPPSCQACIQQSCGMYGEQCDAYQGCANCLIDPFTGCSDPGVAPNLGLCICGACKPECSLPCLILAPDEGQ